MKYPEVKDSSYQIWYSGKKELFQGHNLRDELLVYEAGFNNTDLIQQCIDLFNSEIEWDGMFDLDEAQKRLFDGHRMFILIEEEVLGHVWFEDDYMYNFFVSQNRTKGDSQEFCKYTCSNIDSDIRLFVAKDNIRGQKFFEGVGFTKK